MLIYKQRYKPRTTREFTKSDLTVYDSAGNTALNALTVYGKSEVVDGAIVSAGEGWATVDLGTASWHYNQNGLFSTHLTPDGVSDSNGRTILCSKYKSGDSYNDATADKTASIYGSSLNLWIRDYDYTNSTTFKSAMSGVLLCYQLADPTQGNAIAVKTDDGSGIDGTMAVFETGTPLRGIPDTDVRDVMVWDGSAGTVTKNCAKVRLVDLTWEYIQGADYNVFRAPILNIKEPQSYSDRLKGLLCSKYAISTNPSYSGMNEKSILKNLSYIFIKDNRFNSTTDFVASLGDAELVYELATPTTQNLTTAENDSIAGLRTFAPSTHAQNNAQTDMTVDYTIRVPTI